LLTGGFASLRNIEQVSAGLVMISQRLRGIGEDGEAIEGLAPKIEKAFREIAGIEIQDGQGGLRDTYSILEDMARVFPTLTDMQRQYLSELSAGNRQIRVLNAILGNWSDVENAINSATNSLGSAERENAKYLESIQGRTQRLKSSFQDLSYSLIDSDWMKGFISFGDSILQFFGQFDGLMGKMIAYPAAILAIGGALSSLTQSNAGQNFLGFFKDIGSPKSLGFMEYCRTHHSDRVFVLVG
jgi:TP901 family phage tail tape measure protein